MGLIPSSNVWLSPFCTGVTSQSIVFLRIICGYTLSMLSATCYYFFAAVPCTTIATGMFSKIIFEES